MSSSPKKTGAGTKAPFPGFMEPALATSIEKVPRGARWVHEIKFDGYRVQLHIANDDIKFFTRRGNDWTKRFKKIAADAYLINAGSAIIDGEIVVPAAVFAEMIEQLMHLPGANAAGRYRHQPVEAGP